MKKSTSWEEGEYAYNDRELLNEHYMCMRLVFFSYEPPDDYTKFPEDLGKVYYHLREAQILLPAYYIAVNKPKKEIYIVVRGSKEANDIFADANGSVANLFGSSSHGGFVQSGKNLFDNLPKKLINAAIRNDYKFYFVGHSLGGACAAVVMMNFKAKHPNMRAKCVTFGCPGLLLPEYSDKWKDPTNWCIDSIFIVGDPIPFACTHNIFASTKTAFTFFHNISKALVEPSDYFPISFLSHKSYEDTSNIYKLLVPPGRLFAIGASAKGSIQIQRYEGSVQYFEGFQPFLTSACHLYNFYYDTMKWFVEKAKIDDFLAKPVQLPPDFIAATPILSAQAQE